MSLPRVDVDPGTFCHEKLLQVPVSGSVSSLSRSLPLRALWHSAHGLGPAFRPLQQAPLPAFPGRRAGRDSARAAPNPQARASVPGIHFSWFRRLHVQIQDLSSQPTGGRRLLWPLPPFSCACIRGGLLGPLFLGHQPCQIRAPPFVPRFPPALSPTPLTLGLGRGLGWGDGSVRSTLGTRGFKEETAVYVGEAREDEQAEEHT